MLFLNRVNEPFSLIHFGNVNHLILTGVVKVAKYILLVVLYHQHHRSRLHP